PRYGYGWPYCGAGACSAGPYDTGIEAGLPAGAGIGAIDLRVRPGDADVWIDGRYVGQASDLDGYPTPLWLRQGSHRLVVSKDGYRRFDEKIAVRPGGRAGLIVRLEKSSH